MRSVVVGVVATWLVLAGTPEAYGQPQTPPADSLPADTQPADAPPADDSAPPAGPALQPADSAPVICDPAANGFRYLEVRGTGFDAWASQRLVGNLVDGTGTVQAQWPSVWVSPQGRLTLEVNLCADPYRGRAALPEGSYSVSVGPGNGQLIAATSIALAPPPEPPAEGDLTAPATLPAGGCNRARPLCVSLRSNRRFSAHDTRARGGGRS